MVQISHVVYFDSLLFKYAYDTLSVFIKSHQAVFDCRRSIFFRINVGEEHPGALICKGRISCEC